MIDFVRDYEKEFRANYADISVEQIILAFDYFIDNSIPVQKIKDKIEEVDKSVYSYNEKDGLIKTYIIEILKELTEEE